MSDDAAPVELRSVVQRFNDSRQTLEQLRERLRSLADTDELQAASSASLSESAESLRKYAAEVAEQTATANAAVSELTSSLEAVREFLQGTDLGAVREQIGRLEALVTSGSTSSATALERITSMLESELTSARAETSAAQSELGTVREELQSLRRTYDSLTAEKKQLEAKIAAVPEKTRRKLGL